MRRTLSLALVASAVVAAGSLASAAHARTTTSAGSEHTTRSVVVRPVTVDGRPAPGYTVTRERDVTVSCAEGPAPAAVDDGIRLCGPSAAYTPACWKSSHHTVLCLRQPRGKELVRLKYSGSFRVSHAKQTPSPQAVVLGNGLECDIRVGGAWGVLHSHPKWLGFYSCSDASIYGPPNGDGIDRTDPRWTAYVWAGGQHVTDRGVRTAWFVGTAA